MATVGENRPLRDEYNVARRALQAALSRYNEFITSYQPVTDPAATLAEIQSIERELSSAGGALSRIKQRNNTNPDLFDPDINIQVENADSQIIVAQNGLAQARRVVEQARVAQENQAPATESAGATVTDAQNANDSGADTQSPSGPSEIIQPDGNIVDQQPDAVPTNADSSVSPDPVAPPAPNTLPPGSTFGYTADGTFRIDIDGVGDVPSTRTATVLTASNQDLQPPDANTNRVSYIYLATKVTSVFLRGQFTQELEGVQMFFSLPPRAGIRTAAATADRNLNTPSQPVSPAIPQGTVNTTVAATGVIAGISDADRIAEEFSVFDADQAVPSNTGVIQPFTVPPASTASEAFIYNEDGELIPSDSVVVGDLVSAPTTTGSSVGVTPDDIAPTRSPSDTVVNNSRAQQGAKEY